MVSLLLMLLLQISFVRDGRLRWRGNRLWQRNRYGWHGMKWDRVTVKCFQKHGTNQLTGIGRGLRRRHRLHGWYVWRHRYSWHRLRRDDPAHFRHGRWSGHNCQWLLRLLFVFLWWLRWTHWYPFAFVQSMMLARRHGELHQYCFRLFRGFWRYRYRILSRTKL